MNLGIMRSKAFGIEGESGQMSVELVLLIPVILMVAAVAANLVDYMGECSRFDRVAAEAVRVYGVSPGYGEYGESACEANIEEAIEEAFEGVESVQVTVESEEVGMLDGEEIEGDGLIYSLIPSFREYTCTLTYTPAFFGSSVFDLVMPELVYTNTYVVDPYEPGGWM